jgi:DNA-binding NtrC family response regulator
MIPVRTLQVEVLSGPDAGRTLETDDEVLTIGSAPGNALCLTDDTVSRFHLELAGGEHGISVADLGSSNGTSSGSVQILRGVVSSGAELRLGNTKLRVRDGDASVVELYGDDELGELKGKTELMRRLMAQVNTAARSAVPVLVIGESGTGKELVARAVHHSGPRASGPFVTLDCGSLAPNLVASELFGHERGAFTGADRQHIGAFERATGGTLFLDEIGELPAELQPQLLGALERKRFRRVGGRSEIDVDVRIVCATNRDLRAEVNTGVFRLDLYYRIAVVVLRIPALRERTADIPILAAHFLKECGHDGAPEEVLPGPVMQQLQAHRWPGNVRELRNWVEATVAMGESPPLSTHESPANSAAGASSAPGAANAAGGENPPESELYGLSYKDARRTVLEAFELRYVTRLLAAANGNVAAAARQAQMDRTYLIKLVQRHGLRTR